MTKHIKFFSHRITYHLKDVPRNRTESISFLCCKQELYILM